MTLADKFFEKFGKWRCAEPCAIEDLPFASDIRRWLDSQEKSNELPIATDGKGRGLGIVPCKHHLHPSECSDPRCRR